MSIHLLALNIGFIIVFPFVVYFSEKGAVQKWEKWF